MRAVSKFVCTAALLLLGQGAAGAQSDPVALSFAEAEASSLERSSEIAIADRGIDAAEANLASGRALRLPKVTLESNVLLWNEALAFDLTIPGMEPPPGMEPDPITVRGRVTSATTLTVAEPLSAQFVINNMIKVRKYELDAAREEFRGAKLTAAYEAAHAYVLVLLASSAADIAATRVTQISAQIARAEVLVDGGVLQPVDALRLEAALAGAKAEVIKARSNVQLAIGLLVLAVGLPPLTQIAVTDDFTADPGPPPLDVVDSVILARQHRAELGVLRMRTEQAKAGADVEKAKLYPSVFAVASFQHNEGLGTFQSKNAWFVGITLSWDVWDWGVNWNAHKAAKASASKLELTQRRVEDGISIQVGAAVVDAQSAFDLIAVTRAGVDASAEAFRIQQDRYAEGAATTTDLLDAEAELANAQLAFASARYAYFGSLVELANATGQLPSAVFDAMKGNQ